MAWPILCGLGTPLRLCSAPYILTAVAEAVEWILLNSYNVPDLLHYLEDFITAGPSDSPQCALNLGTALAVYKKLALPIHPGKYVGPSLLLTVLGIELDSLAQVARLPAYKLCALLIRSWLPRKWCDRHKLESLIGHLHHVAMCGVISGARGMSCFILTMMLWSIC